MTGGSIEVSERHQSAILDQYKIYVEMADRVSARRGTTNTFFLSLNTLVVTLVATGSRGSPAVPAWSLALATVALLLQCGSWFWLLRSYRQLSAAKYTVIGLLEERLPASPYVRAEWQALGRGQDPSRYAPTTRIEQWVPLSFATVYIIGFASVLLA